MVVFWSAFLCGQVICILWDFFRALRKTKNHTKSLVAVEDIIFCFLSFKIFFDTTYYFNNGKLRWFIFAAIISSFILYFISESNYVINFFMFIFKITKIFFTPIIKTINIFKNLLAKPLIIIKNRCFSVLSKTKSVFDNNIKKIFKKFCKIKQ